MKTLKEWAERLNCREYGEELSRLEIEQLKSLGFVVVYGASDDLCEFNGAIDDEVGCYGGRIISLNLQGISHNLQIRDQYKTIEAIWGKEIAWQYKTDIPHETFEILEDSEVYCRGIIFDIKSLDNKPL